MNARLWLGAPLEGVNKMEQTCEPGGVRCSELFASELRLRAPPNEFILDAAGTVKMEDGEVRAVGRCRLNP